MSPLNKGPLLGPRSTGVRPLPPPRFGGRLVLPGMPPLPINPIFGGSGPMRQRLPPPPLPPPPRPTGVSRPNGLLPLFPGSRARGMAPGIVPPIRPRGAGMSHGLTPGFVPPMRPRGTGMPRGPLMRPWPGRIPPPQMIPPMMRPRFSMGNGNVKGKAMNNTKKVNKLEELELKKPWMTDEIRSEIQKKNKLYAKAKKNKDAIEWEEFKDLRNKVTRMIRDAKNEYLVKHPEQGGQKTDDSNTIESEGVQKTENSTEQSEQMEQKEETQPSSEQAHLYPDDRESYDQRDENYVSSEDDTTKMSYYCEICDKDCLCDCHALIEHKSMHKLCDIDGCTFSAHPLLIKQHIQMQHSTGLYQRMKNLPEDNEKWIMERAKRFPTIARIALCKAEELEKLQRGEIIKQNCNAQMKTKRMTRIHEKKRKSRKKYIDEPNKNDIHTNEIYRGLYPFPGTGILQDEDSNEVCLDEVEKTDLYNEIADDISDEDDASQASIKSEPHTICVPSLVANYESETEEDDIPKEVPIQKIKIKDLQDFKVAENAMVYKETFNDVQFCLNVNDKPNDIKVTDKITEHSVTKYQNKRKHETDQIMKDKRNEKVLNRYHNKLLHKLLARSIQHERNLICQCLKYIVDNNFFDLS